MIRRDCREAYSKAIECTPPNKFYEIDIEELVRMKEMIEENSKILSVVEKHMMQAQNMTSMNMKKQVYSSLVM